MQSGHREIVGEGKHKMFHADFFFLEFYWQVEMSEMLSRNLQRQFRGDKID